MDSDNNITNQFILSSIFAVLNKPLKYALNWMKNTVFVLFFVVFLSNITASVFTNHLQQTDYVCEFDFDSDEIDEEDFGYEGFSFQHSRSEFQKNFDIANTGIPFHVKGITSKSYSVHFSRKRFVVLHNLKLNC
ncbi:MAG: hypothetical protein EBT66_05275 [Bacteroidetes bacterium]|nr:hypothetical protein [Bacteroidota bacterium]